MGSGAELLCKLFSGGGPHFLVPGLCQLSLLSLTQPLGSFLPRTEKGDGNEEEDLRLDCRHERHAARKWPRRREPAHRPWAVCRGRARR